MIQMKKQTNKKRARREPIEFVSDVDGQLSSKRLISFVSFFVILASWAGILFFSSQTIPEFMFNGFLWLVIAGMGSSVMEKFSLSRDRATYREFHSFSSYEGSQDPSFYTLDTDEPLDTDKSDKVIGDFDPNAS